MPSSTLPRGGLHQVTRQLGLTEVLGRVAGDDNQDLASSQWAAARMLSHRIQRTGREIGERGFDPPPEKGPALADRLRCGAVSLELSLALTPERFAT